MFIRGVSNLDFFHKKLLGKQWVPPHWSSKITVIQHKIISSRLPIHINYFKFYYINGVVYSTKQCFGWLYGWTVGDSLRHIGHRASSQSDITSLFSLFFDLHDTLAIYSIWQVIEGVLLHTTKAVPMVPGQHSIRSLCHHLFYVARN